MLPRVYIFLISTFLCLNSICKAQVPVQPNWTEDKSKSKIPSKVHVEITNKNLYETAVIREEINKAIYDGKYAVGRENEEEIVELADEYLGKEYRISEYLSELMGDSVEELFHYNDSDHDNATETLLEIVMESHDGNFTKKITTTEITPNIIESILAQEVYANTNGETFIPQYRPEDYSSRLKTREMLEITHITEDLNFILGQGVQYWNILKKNNRNEYRKVIGLKNDGIILLGEKNGKFEVIHEYHVQFESKSILETMTLWNNTSGEVNGFLIISNRTEIHWLDDNKLETLWKWHIERPVTALKYFESENNHFLIVVTNGTTDVGNASVAVYQFDLFKKEIWLRQLIPLQVECTEIAFLNTGRDLVAAFPQTDHVIIFQYNNHEGRFKNITKILSVDVKSVSGFQMGGFSYLAIGGYQPQILRYHRGKFHPQTILNPSFGLVEFFLPVQARTYRDDLILLVQHRLDFTTHDLSVLEALIWDGEAFVTSLSIPCHIGHFVFNFGVNCMIDVDRKDGIKGSAVLIDGQNITILVPRHEAPSGIFSLNFELIPRNTELEHLNDIFSYLKIIAENQEAIIEEAESVLVSENSMLDKSSGEWIIDELETHHLIFDGKIDNLFLNEYQWIPADSDVNITALLDSLETFGKDLDMLIENTEHQEIKNENAFFGEDPKSLVKRETSEKIIKMLRIDVLHVDELFIKNINNIPIEEIFFINDNEIRHNGTIIFDADATIHKLSLISQADTSPQLRNAEDSLISLTRDNLHINGNLEFDTINGMPWAEFISEIIMMDTPNHFEEMEVLGQVILENNLSIDVLNEQKFPDGYLLSNGPQESIILGEKKFHETIKSNAVDCEGRINGVNPFDFITLSDPQIITGETTFSYVEVTASLEINGTISGKYMDEFLANPNILKANFIEASCVFQHLEVNGPITIEGDFNGLTLDEILNEVIYKTDEEIEIPSFKKFNKIIFENELELTSNLISGIELYDFVTKTTDQELNITILEGNIFFNNLRIEGLYDFVNVTELDENSIKTFGEQYTEAQLEFADENGIVADNLEILSHLNNIPVDQYYRIYDDIVLEEATFGNLRIDSLTTECQVEGNGTLNGVDLYEFDINRMSYSRNQTIPENFSIGNAVVEQDLIVNNINGLESDYILPILEKFNNITELIISENIFLPKLIITGNITVNDINGNNFNEIQENAIWLNKENYINGDIEFLDDITIEGDLKLDGYLNNQNFDEFIDDLVLKSDPIIINSAKKFIKPIVIVNNAEIKYINGKPFSDIATKRSIAYFQGSLQIHGDIYVNDLTVGGQFNNYNMNGFNNLYKYDEEHDVHIIGTEVVFKGNVTVNSLHSEGGFGSIANVNDFLQNLVLKNELVNISGHKIFRNDVKFTENLNIEWFNDIDASDIFDGIVLINDPDPIIIHTSVTFKEPVSANYIQVNDELATYNLMGCSIYEWLENGLRTDLDIDVPGPLHFHEGALDGNSLNAVYVNKKLISDAITIYTPQNISRYIQFSDVILGESLMVDGYINRVNLQKERDNTLMVSGDQHITAPTTMQSLRVLKNLETLAAICDKDIRHAATLYGDIQIRSPITFTDVTADRIYSNDLISGIDFIDWYLNSLWSSGRDFQIVTGNWTADEIIVKGFLDGNGMINEVPVSSLEQQFQELDLNASSEFENEYNFQCHRAKYLLSETQKRPYFLKYFEKSFNLITDGDVISSIVFRNGNEHFLIANYKCFSEVYLWKITESQFERKYAFEAGYVKQIIIVPNDNGNIHLITNSEDNLFNCKLAGINIWEFYRNQTNLYKNIGETHDQYSTIYSDPNLLGKFYAVNRKTDSLIEFETTSLNQRKWHLPSDLVENYGFIPYEAELGRVLSDGSHMVLIESNHPSPLSKKLRTKRFSSKSFRERLQNFTESIKLKEPASKFSAKYRETKLKSETVFKSNLRNLGNGRLVRPSSDVIKSELRHTIDDVIVGLVNDLELLKCPQQIFDEELGKGWDSDKLYSDDESDGLLNAYQTTSASSFQTEMNTASLSKEIETTEIIRQNNGKTNISEPNYNGLKDVVKEVAKKLWVGLIEVESIRNVINHAKGIYDEFVSQNVENSTTVDMKLDDPKDLILGDSLTAAIDRFSDIMETTINDIDNLEGFFNNSTEVGASLHLENENKTNYQIFEEKIQNVIEELLQMVKNINETEIISNTNVASASNSFYSDTQSLFNLEKPTDYDTPSDKNDSNTKSVDNDAQTVIPIFVGIEEEPDDINNKTGLKSTNTMIDLIQQTTTKRLETHQKLENNLQVSEAESLMSSVEFDNFRNESIVPEVFTMPGNKVEDDLITIPVPSYDHTQNYANKIGNEFLLSPATSDDIQQILSSSGIQYQEDSIISKSVPSSSNTETQVLYEKNTMENIVDLDTSSESIISDFNQKITSPPTASKTQMRTKNNLQNFEIDSVTVKNEDRILQNNLNENSELIGATELILNFTENGEEYVSITESSTSGNNLWLLLNSSASNETFTQLFAEATNTKFPILVKDVERDSPYHDSQKYNANTVKEPRVSSGNQDQRVSFNSTSLVHSENVESPILFEQNPLKNSQDLGVIVTQVNSTELIIPEYSFTENVYKFNPIMESSTSGINLLLLLNTSAANESSTQLFPEETNSNFPISVQVKAVDMDHPKYTDAQKYNANIVKESREESSGNQDQSLSIASKSVANTKNVGSKILFEKNPLKHSQDLGEIATEVNYTEHAELTPEHSFTENGEEHVPIIESSTSGNNLLLLLNSSAANESSTQLFPEETNSNFPISVQVKAVDMDHPKYTDAQKYNANIVKESREESSGNQDQSLSIASKSVANTKNIGSKILLEKNPLKHSQDLGKIATQVNSTEHAELTPEHSFTENGEEYVLLLNTSAANESSEQLFSDTKFPMSVQVKDVETDTPYYDSQKYNANTVKESGVVSSGKQGQRVSISSNSEANTTNMPSQILFEQNPLENSRDLGDIETQVNSIEHAELIPEYSKSIVLDHIPKSISPNITRTIQLIIPKNTTLQTFTSESTTNQNEKSVLQEPNVGDNFINSTINLKPYLDTTMQPNLLYYENPPVTIAEIKSFPEEITELIPARDTEQELKHTEIVSSHNSDITETYPVYTEAHIAEEILPTSLLRTDNTYLPGRHTGEVVGLRVGPKENRKTLVAVAEYNAYGIVAGQQESIKIYFDIMQGHLFQTVSAYKPRSLTALHMRDETILAFVEDDSIVKIFKYKGIEGFVEVITFNTESFITSLYSTTLPSYNKASLKFYLVLVVKNEIQFFEAVMGGEHEVLEDVKCN